MGQKRRVPAGPKTSDQLAVSLLRRAGVRTGMPRALGKALALKVIGARRRSFERGAKDAWAIALRAFERLRSDSEARASLDSAERLGGYRAIVALVSVYGRKLPERLSPEERVRRQQEGRAKRSDLLARRAAAELKKARARLAAAQKAVARAEASVAKWRGRVRYHAERGRLDVPEEDE